MKGKPPSSLWGQRTRAAGLPLVQLAALAGLRQDHVSKVLAAAGPPAGHLIGLILAWEMLDDARRDAWMRKLDTAAPEDVPALLASLGAGFLPRHSLALLLALDLITTEERRHWRAEVESATHHCHAKQL